MDYDKSNPFNYEKKIQILVLDYQYQHQNMLILIYSDTEALRFRFWNFLQS